MTRLGKNLDEVEQLEYEIRLLRRVVSKMNDLSFDVGVLDHNEFMAYLRAATND